MGIYLADGAEQEAVLVLVVPGSCTGSLGVVE